ncbi:MAG: preprotein translocase subunit SecE [Candidatus Azambacteria bacterium]|nr:preprotein translocase subunit SecE [Candidatus Azambacteria bacterium]
MSYLEKTKTYFKEVKVEMNKVNWPTRTETINYTLVVIGVSVAIAAYLSSLDFLFTSVLNFFLFK